MRFIDVKPTKDKKRIKYYCLPFIPPNTVQNDFQMTHQEWHLHNFYIQ